MLVAFRDAVMSKAKLSTGCSLASLPLLPITPFRFKVAFIIFQSEASRLACELGISPENLDIFNFALLVTFFKNMAPIII